MYNIIIWKVILFFFIKKRYFVTISYIYYIYFIKTIIFESFIILIICVEFKKLSI